MWAASALTTQSGGSGTTSTNQVDRELDDDGRWTAVAQRIEFVDNGELVSSIEGSVSRAWDCP